MSSSPATPSSRPLASPTDDGEPPPPRAFDDVWRHALADHYEDTALLALPSHFVDQAARALYAPTDLPRDWRAQLEAFVERLLREAARTAPGRG